MKADSSGIGINFDEGDLGVDDFETMGDYLAYYVIPRIGQLTDIIQNGVSWAKPYPGVPIPTDAVYDIDNVAWIPYVTFPNDLTLRLWMTRQLDGRTATINFQHWMPDSDAMHFIDLIDTMQGNFHSAPWGYAVGYMTGRVIFLAWHYQLEGMRTIWDKLLNIRKWFGSN